MQCGYPRHSRRTRQVCDNNNPKTKKPAQRSGTVVGVLIEVPVMLMLVGFCKKTEHWFPGSRQ